MPHENKFPSRAQAENILSVQTKFDSPPPSQNQMVVLSLHCVPKAQSITDKLSVTHCALSVAPFTTSLTLQLYELLCLAKDH